MRDLLAKMMFWLQEDRNYIHLFVLYRLTVSVFSKTNIQRSVGGWRWILHCRFAARLISNIMINQIFLFGANMTEYSSTKTRGIRGYYPSDIPQFWNLTSITISLSSKFHSIRESFLWLLQEKVNIVLFIKSYRKPCQAANSKLFVNIFFHALCKNIWKIIAQ